MGKKSGINSRELEWSVLEKVICRVSFNRPRLIFSGGEPLTYSRFQDLADLLKAKRLHAIVCTNGTLIDKFAATLSGNKYVSLLISLDGVGEVNDMVRGDGVYGRVTSNIRLLKSMKRPPHIGVSFTVMPENVGSMHAFCKEMVGYGVDWITFNPCWFITGGESTAYEEYMTRVFNVAGRTHRGYTSPYELDANEYRRQMRRIGDEEWPVQVSSYFSACDSDFEAYAGSKPVKAGDFLCLKQWLRMDVTAEGKVSPCILYPDITFGDLESDDALDVWNSTDYAQFREKISREPIPICNKCDVRYLYDPRGIVPR